MKIANIVRQRAMVPMILGWLMALAVLSAPAASAAAEADPPDSRDPFGLERVPRSWIVDYAHDPELRTREFVMSRVDRVRRDLRVQDELQLQAEAESVTYRIPEGVTVDQVLEHYADVLGDDVLFRCSGRDCGRSNDWANQVFGQATLYGPDRNQRYVARQWQDQLVSLYVIERGNKRVYAHLQFLDPQGQLGIEPNALLGRRLAERGWAVVEAVTPSADGVLPDSARDVLAGLAAALARFAGESMYLVCHLYGRDAGDVLLTASQRCAEAGVELIVAGAEGAGDGSALDLKPFGAGPLLPRATPSAARLELVLPAVAFSQGE